MHEADASLIVGEEAASGWVARTIGRRGRRRQPLLLALALHALVVLVALRSATTALSHRTHRQDAGLSVSAWGFFALNRHGATLCSSVLHDYDEKADGERT